MPRNLDKFFRNPPRGGNEKGVPTENSMSPLPEQEEYDALKREFAQVAGGGTGELEAGSTRGDSELNAQMRAGEMSARASTQESALVGQSDFRNRRRPNTQGAAAGSGYHEYEHMHENDGGRADAGTGANPKPMCDPDTSQPTRSDGKKAHSMGTANGNKTRRRPIRTSRSGPFD